MSQIHSFWIKLKLWAVKILFKKSTKKVISLLLGMKSNSAVGIKLTQILWGTWARGVHATNWVEMWGNNIQPHRTQNNATETSQSKQKKSKTISSTPQKLNILMRAKKSTQSIKKLNTPTDSNNWSYSRKIKSNYSWRCLWFR